MLDVSFGRHVLAGDLAKSIVTGSSPTHVVTIQQLLGDAFGYGWTRVVGAWFRGTNRDSTKYKFYPGIQSPGNTDTTQGIDSTFNLDTPHSNTAWIRVECPNNGEVEIPDFDTKNNPPIGLAGIFDTQFGIAYDENGDTDESRFLNNPADVIGFGCRTIRGYPQARVDWGSLSTLQSACNGTVTPDYTTLPQGVGLTARYFADTTFSSLIEKRVDPVIEFDPSAGAPALGIPPTGFSARFEGKIRFKYSETYLMSLLHNDTGKLWINDLTTPIINGATSGVDTGNFTAVADQWYDIKLEWTNTSGDSQFILEWQSTTQAIQIVPQDRLYPKAEAVPRFVTNMAFSTRTTFDQFLRSVLFTCNGGFQDVGGKLRFFCITDESSSFDFDQTNIDKTQPFTFSPRFTQQELLALPNRYIGDGRDTDDRYLQKFDPPLYYDMPALQAIAGRVIEETVAVGNTTRWQGLTNLAHYAKVKTQPIVCQFEGLPQTIGVMQGDIVRVSHPSPNWSFKPFLCIEATDKSVDSGPDNRIFKLINWD